MDNLLVQLIAMLLLSATSGATEYSKGGNASLISQDEVLLTSNVLVRDTFEPDDRPNQASWIGVGGPRQTHTIDTAEDEDWLQFYSEVGDRITIETLNLGHEVNTFVELFAEDGITLLGENDDAEEGSLSSILIFDCTYADFYFVRITNIPSSVLGASSSYDVQVLGEVGGSVPGALTGLVTSSSSGTPVPDAQVSLSNFGFVSTLTNSDGVYTIAALPPRSYDLEVWATGFQIASDDAVVVDGAFTRADFTLLTASIGTQGEGEGEGESLTSPPGCSSGTGGLEGAADRGKKDSVLLMLLALAVLIAIRKNWSEWRMHSQWAQQETTHARVVTSDRQ